MHCAIPPENYTNWPVSSEPARVAKNAPDQLVVNGIVGEGTVVSLQIRGCMTRGVLFEIQNS
ncbi:MAG TPA: hypothetical protein VGL72_08340 [Bryobacteraceae bacterium]|jgi:hypothetical protein